MILRIEEGIDIPIYQQIRNQSMGFPAESWRLENSCPRCGLWRRRLASMS